MKREDLAKALGVTTLGTNAVAVDAATVTKRANFNCIVVDLRFYISDEATEQQESRLKKLML